MEVPEAFKVQLTNLLSSYFELKDELVETDPAGASSQASKARESLLKVDMKLLDEDAHNIWMELLSPIQKSITSIEKSADVADQRNSFQVLSDHMIEAVEYFGVEKDKVYKQFCPMAFDDKGAFWLSGEEEIKNPYYGDMMLTCGEVKNVFEKGRPTTTSKDAPARAGAAHQH